MKTKSADPHEQLHVLMATCMDCGAHEITELCGTQCHSKHDETCPEYAASLTVERIAELERELAASQALCRKFAQALDAHPEHLK